MLKEKSRRLIELRQKIADIEDTLLTPIKQERDAVQAEILQELKDTEQFSVRFDWATITRAVRKTARVVDEIATMAFLKKKKLAKEYISPKLNDLFYSSYLREAQKQGIEVAGVEIQENEYISVRTAQEDTEKRKVNVE